MLSTIENDKVRLVIDTKGATILSCSIDNIDVLQNCEIKKSFTKDECGGFPLVPIANRVKNNFYLLDDKKVELLPTSSDNKEYLHGLGWIKNWQVKEQKSDSIVLYLESNGEIETHYNFSCEFEIKLAPLGILFNLKVKHLDKDVSRLYGLGMHPYFAIDKGDELLVNALGFCRSHSDDYFLEIPSDSFDSRFDYRDFKKIGDIFCNHAYVSCNGALLKRHKYNKIIKLTSTCNNLMMYHSKGCNFIALEPQTHLVDGVNMQEGRGNMCLLNKYFDTLSMSMRIDLL